MEIKIILENKKQYIDLLLLADEQESMIDIYLETGIMFALYDKNSVKCVHQMPGTLLLLATEHTLTVKKNIRISL